MFANQKHVGLVKWQIFMILLFFSVAFSQAQTTIESENTFDELVSLITNKTYKFDAEWATSQSGVRAKMITDSNYVIVDNTESLGHLPYYGIISTGGLQNNSEIYFKEAIEDYRVTVKEKSKKIKVKYKVHSHGVLYYVSFTTFHDGNTILSISSRVSNALSFEGQILKL